MFNIWKYTKSSQGPFSSTISGFNPRMCMPNHDRVRQHKYSLFVEGHVQVCPGR